MRTVVAGLAAVAAAVAGSVMVGLPAQAAPETTTAPTDYVVLAATTADTAAAESAVKAAGGTVTGRNDSVGYVLARSTSGEFVTNLDASPAVAGAARNRVVGEAPKDEVASQTQIEKLSVDAKAAATEGGAATAPAAGAEPLAPAQWDMQQIDATVTGSYAKQKGSKKVLVGIIDTGVDGTHPDIAPNFDAKLSRNFTTDMPDIDGPCEVASCVDPANVDDDGHGTHVASTIGSPVNGLGMAGVAPNVTLVNIRAGQDSGFFFLDATLKALTYAGDIGVDVVNMSYYVDPWLFNCLDNAADTSAERAEQKVVREATQRALNYARGKGVLPVSAEGNGATDLNKPTTDVSSPDYPVDAAKERTVDNSCLTVPSESMGVVTVSSTGISKRKAYYSDYGTEETDVAAPGGDTYDTPTNTRDVTKAVLAAYPEALGRTAGTIDAAGDPTVDSVVKDCKASTCGYYQYIQGTSMASPHAAGVAALIVSQFGLPDLRKGGLTLPPALTEAQLLRSATATACPTPRTYHYTRITPAGATLTADHTCEGPKSDNGFYGHGIVNAKAALSLR